MSFNSAIAIEAVKAAAIIGYCSSDGDCCFYCCCCWNLNWFVRSGSNCGFFGSSYYWYYYLWELKKIGAASDDVEGEAHFCSLQQWRSRSHQLSFGCC